MADGGKLEKACLRVVEGEVSPNELRFSFNPAEYTVAKSANWTRPSAPGARPVTKPQFQASNPQTVQMEIFFDEFESGGQVADKINALFEWLKPTAASVKKKFPQPPILAFEWGSNQSLKGFRAYLKTVSVKYTMFNLKGQPSRASANVTLEEVPIPPKKQNPTSGAIHGRSTHVLKEGDSLASVAYLEYGDASLWRGLAAFNDIDDPLRLKPGTRILVPTVSEALRLA